MKNTTKKTVYDIITDLIIKKIEKGVIPWEKPWKTVAPKNFVTMKEYRWLNTLLLGMQWRDCPYWLTFKQVKELKGTIKKEELKNSAIVTYSSYISLDINWNKTDEENAVEKKHYLRYYRVYNLEQCNWIEWTMPEKKELDSIQEAENIINNYNWPEKTFWWSEAYYSPSTDTVNIPQKWYFKNEEWYYSTFFHELVHSTGHEKRLDRKWIVKHNKFGSKVYSYEELVAELWASFLCAKSNINNYIDNNVSYINGWLKALKGNTRMIVMASASAQKAVDYIIK